MGDSIKWAAERAEEEAADRLLEKDTRRYKKFKDDPVFLFQTLRDSLEKLEELSDEVSMTKDQHQKLEEVTKDLRSITK